MIDFACKRFEIDEIIRCSLGLTKSDLKIMDFLLKNSKKQFSSLNLSEKMSLDISTIQRSVKSLHEKNIIVRNQVNLAKGGYTYVYMIRDKEDIKKKLVGILKGWFEKAEKEVRNL